MQKDDDFTSDEYLKSIYSSKRRLQRRVLSLEKLIAKNIYNFQNFNIQNFSFESSYAFLSSWKFPKVYFNQSTFWCDAIEFNDYKMLDNKTFSFNGHAWIGHYPDQNGDQWKVSTSGCFTINANGTRLKNYDLYFENKGQLLHLYKKSR